MPGLISVLFILCQNDSYVLPMLWLGSPLKLSCPMTVSTAIPMYSLSAPLVFCSAYGMAVQIPGQEHNNRTLDLQCPYQSTPDTPPTTSPWTSPTPPNATKGKPGPSVVTRTDVFCSFQQMKVVLPPGPISEIVLKGVCLLVYAPGAYGKCNLHSEYRLPCGSSSISQTQCLAMGCCFNKHPPACYYPMDGELHSVSLLAFSRHLAKCSGAVLEYAKVL
ncbi:hypothetical protein GOODEAATRI_014202 [Goodea atripinnis]|uniref:P-type domain-containing protein n=1 Tax=Goodea atripinnis TaxID=208336 RepID=A0ABV0MRZ4_9TELE